MGTTLFVTDQVVGKYRIVGELGRGAMGTVFKAVDETLDREVAIKVLNPELANAKFIKRFEAEATTLAKLNHPSIATIYELVRSAAGLLMVMEFVAGETLETIADRVGTIAPDRAASLIDKVLAGLAYAHRAGIVHCDVKPANVIVTPHGVKIMDFGVARVRGAGHVLPDGYVIGTPAYMAPEQVLGAAVDMRTDVYSVGVVFYRLLSGALPFGGDTPTAMVREQLSAPPTQLRVHRDRLPDWCDPMLRRALAKSPGDRFQSADEFREALARATGMPTPELTGDLSGLMPSDQPAAAGAPQKNPLAAGPTRVAAIAAWALSNANRATVVLRGSPYAFTSSFLGLLLTCGGLITLLAMDHPALAPAIAEAPPRPDAPKRAAVAHVFLSASRPPVAVPAVTEAPAAPKRPARREARDTIAARGRLTRLPSRALPFAFDAKALTESGKRREKQDAKIVLADGMINVQVRDDTILYSVPYERVVSISYSEGRDPLWNGPKGPARVARADGGVFGVFRVTRYWVSVRTTDERARFVALLFPSAERARNAMTALAQRTGCRAQIVADADD
jgi:predicted Ser/Thr protein kinase